MQEVAMTMTSLCNGEKDKFYDILNTFTFNDPCGHARLFTKY